MQTNKLKSLVLLLCIGPSAFCEEAETEVADVVELDSHLVTASPFVTSLEELIVPVNQLKGDALLRKRQSTLGGTLDGQVGVHSSYFGPGAGRPVIRGFDGDRVRILNQGTDTFDVAQTSPDHGVSVEPLFSESVEVVRGPASLLYGNGAIGGVVNVIGKDIPSFRADTPLSGEFEASHSSVSDQNSAGLSLTGGSGDIAWSAGYLQRDSGDLEIPGFAESAYQRESEADESVGEAGGEEEAFGVLENSSVDTRSGYLGATWFGDKSLFGISYSIYESDYGVPGHSHAHEEEHHEEEGSGHEEEAPVTIDLDQFRIALRGELLEPNGFFEKVELKIGYGDYRHQELEGEEVGTLFERDGTELRLTGVHVPVGRFSGAVGLHVNHDSFSATGEEAFIPSNETASYGVFLVERLDRDWGAWEFGGRLESIDVDPNDRDLGGRSFSTGNASLGFVRGLGESRVLASNLTYAERAPNAKELFAFGPHVGTQSFEIGNAALGKEKSMNLDLSYRVTSGFITGSLTGFYSDFSDYVYMRTLDSATVASEYPDLDTDELPVLRATAVDAKFYGYELDLKLRLIDQSERSLELDLLMDQVRATNESFNTNLPRIPTRRIGGRFEYAEGPWLIGLEGKYSQAASHLAPEDSPTDSFMQWGADVRYRIQTTDTRTIELFAIGENLGDEESRSHVSYLKDLAPMPGRNIQLGVRTSF